MKAILLAAGISKRLYPLQDKNLLNFCGKPLIYWQIKRLKDAGFKKIVIVAGPHNIEKIQNFFIKNKEIKIINQDSKYPKGMAGAIICANEVWKEENEALVFSGNDFIDIKGLKNLLKISKTTQKGIDGFILTYDVKEYFAGGYIVADEKGIINAIVEKPKKGKEPSNTINLVVHLHKNLQEFVEELKKIKTIKDDQYEEALNSFFRKGKKYRAVKHEGFWQSIKYPWHILKIWPLIFGEIKVKIAKSAKIHPSAIINGRVYIGENVKIFENSVINGPTYIGDNSIIADNSLVRESHIGEDSVVGFSTEVARSYWGEEVWTHSNYIGDSILEKNISFGAGGITANLRLDETEINVLVDSKKIQTGLNKLGAIIGKDVRIGVNTCIMPGRKIGNNCIIGSNINIDKDIPPNSYINSKSILEIKKNTKDISRLSRKENLNILSKNK